MPNDREYYESWLRGLDLRELDLKAVLLMLEGQLTRVKKDHCRFMIELFNRGQHDT